MSETALATIEVRGTEKLEDGKTELKFLDINNEEISRLEIR